MMVLMDRFWMEGLFVSIGRDCCVFALCVIIQ